MQFVIVRKLDKRHLGRFPFFDHKTEYQKFNISINLFIIVLFDGIADRVTSIIFDTKFYDHKTK